MKAILISIACAVVLNCLSCKKENQKENKGITTFIKGRVVDSIRGVPVAGYKIVLVKKIGLHCAGWECGTLFETVATTYTDSSGNYLIMFNHNLQPGQGYYFEEQYYGIPYYHESSSGSGPIVAGTTNIMNMNVWEPVELKLNVQVTNNYYPPLVVRSEFSGSGLNFLNTENIYQQNINGTYILRTKPNSDVNISFHYYINYNSPNPILHQMVIHYHTSLDSVTALNYTVDCSTF